MDHQDLKQLISNMLDLKVLPQKCELNSVIHKKTGKKYYVTDVCLNCTNGHEDVVMVLYKNEDDMLFCREANEFNVKFISVKKYKEVNK